MPSTILGTFIYMILFNFPRAIGIIISTFYRWWHWYTGRRIKQQGICDPFQSWNHIFRVLPLEDEHPEFWRNRNIPDTMEEWGDPTGEKLYLCPGLCGTQWSPLGDTAAGPFWDVLPACKPLPFLRTTPSQRCSTLQYYMTQLTGPNLSEFSLTGVWTWEILVNLCCISELGKGEKLSWRWPYLPLIICTKAKGRRGGQRGTEVRLGSPEKQRITQAPDVLSGPDSSLLWVYLYFLFLIAPVIVLQILTGLKLAWPSLVK